MFGVVVVLMVFKPSISKCYPPPQTGLPSASQDILTFVKGSDGVCSSVAALWGFAGTLQQIILHARLTSGRLTNWGEPAGATGQYWQTEHAQTWGRKVVQSADGARVTVLRALGYDFFLYGGGERRGPESVCSPAKHSFKVSSFFSSMKEGHWIAFPFI